METVIRQTITKVHHLLQHLKVMDMKVIDSQLDAMARVVAITAAAAVNKGVSNTILILTTSNDC